MNSNKKESVIQADPGNDRNNFILDKPAIIVGKVLNHEVYPNINEIKLTVPGFRGDTRIYTTEIDDSGNFRIEFYPKTKREISLYPIEDVLVIQPGDSLYILKDFKDIGNSVFSGDGAVLNNEISKFRTIYLGRYPANYKQTYLDFKKSCEQKKTDNYLRLADFVQQYNCSDEFVNWANKQIELDYCEALFRYPRQYFARTKEELSDSSEYFSFIEKFEACFDNSIILADFFKVTEKYVNCKMVDLTGKYRQKIEQKDTIVDLLIDDIFSATGNNYLAQFALRSYLSISLNANKTGWIDGYLEQINNKIKDPFLRNNLQEHYARVQEFNQNPKPFSDDILGRKINPEFNGGISFTSETENNIVEELINENNNKVIYIDFWATGCPPCLRYMQYSKQLISEFENEDVVFAFICINSEKSIWEKKIEELNIGGEHIYCHAEMSRSIWKRFGFKGIPYYLLINKDGTIVDFGHHLNPQNEYVKNEIENLLNI